ncbi:MAG: outer membrane lipoprotein-sorting protein [Verrucomicrobiales bacterium]
MMISLDSPALTWVRRLLVAAALLVTPPLIAQDTAPTAADLAARLSQALQDGTSMVRLKIESRAAAGAPKSVVQIQVKSRRTPTATEIVYTVLWPKERKGEAFLLRKSGDRPATGHLFTPPDQLRQLTTAQLQDGIFGTDLSYEDIVDNFYAWKNQQIVGTETVDRVPCYILESKPGSGQRSGYSRVRSWIDPKRLVPLRIEKFLPSGALARRIETTRVAKDDLDRPVPASFSVRRGGQPSVTELEGSNSRHDIPLSDADFTTEALKAGVGSKP